MSLGNVAFHWMASGLRCWQRFVVVRQSTLKGEYVKKCIRIGVIVLKIVICGCK